MEITLADFLLTRLKTCGAGHIFGVPGDYVLPFDKAIENYSFPFIGTRTELGAGYMADVYARVQGLGAACITYGVGISILSAVAGAFVENSPLVVISGAPSLTDASSHKYLHHLIQGTETQKKLFQHVTCAQGILADPKTAPAEIDRVLKMCLLHKKPVYLELPKDMVEKKIVSFPWEAPTFPCDPKSLENLLQKTKKFFKAGKRPLLWLGHEVLRFGLSQKILTFAEKWQLPIVTSLLGKSAISESHPLFRGVFAGALSQQLVENLVSESDSLLLLGVTLSDLETGIFTAHLEGKNILFIDQNNTPKVPLPHFVQALSQIENISSYLPPSLPKTKFIPKNEKLTSHRLFETINAHLTKEHVVIAEIGDSLFGGMDLILEQNQFFSSAYFGSLGFALPGACALQLALPKKRVIALLGDGAFQMSCPELSTAICYGLDPIMIVLNNHGYGTERPLLEGAYNDIPNWDYPSLPKVFGGVLGFRVTSEKEFIFAFKSALDQRGNLSLIEVELEKTDFSRALSKLGKISKI